jgi:hypothetical protein
MESRQALDVVDVQMSGPRQRVETGDGVDQPAGTADVKCGALWSGHQQIAESSIFVLQQ